MGRRVEIARWLADWYREYKTGENQIRVANQAVVVVRRRFLDKLFHKQPSRRDIVFRGRGTHSIDFVWKGEGKGWDCWFTGCLYLLRKGKYKRVKVVQRWCVVIDFLIHSKFVKFIRDKTRCSFSPLASYVTLNFTSNFKIKYGKVFFQVNALIIFVLSFPKKKKKNLLIITSNYVPFLPFFRQIIFQ